MYSAWIKFLLKKKRIPAANIRGVTFTNAAAEQMRERLEQIGIAPAQSPSISTLHSLATRLLHESRLKVGLSPSFRPLDGVARRIVLKDVAEDLMAMGVNISFRGPIKIRTLLNAYESDKAGKGVPKLFTKDPKLAKV